MIIALRSGSFPAISSKSMPTAVAAISSMGCATAVTAGVRWGKKGWSSKETMERSRGMESARSLQAFSVHSTRSPAATNTAVTEDRLQSRSRAFLSAEAVS